MGTTRVTRSRVVVMAVVALMLTAFAAPVAAHPDHKHSDAPLPKHASEKMRHFWSDHEPAADFQAQSGTPCVDGFAGPWPCDNVDLLSYMPLADIGGTRSNSAANDIWGWTDPQNGKEYAIIGRVFGTSFIDISDPVNPVYLGQLSTHGAFGSSWRDIKVYANHAFIVSEANQHGMQVFDLTQLRNVSNPPVNFSATAHYNNNAQAHNIAINEDSGYAYIVGATGKNNCSGGLHMVNIQNPANPTFAGCYSGDGYTHDTQCVIYDGPDGNYQGREICFNSNEDTLTIVDVTNKSAPVMLSRLPYPGSAYTHQGWLTEDKQYFLLDDELDETNFGHNTRTRVFDVSDLTAPVLTGYTDSTAAAIDHNQYVKGNISYQANYRAGLRVMEITDPANGVLTELGFFDVYPADDAAAFNGAWSNYPYFDSGVVIISGIEQGLFVVMPHVDSDPGDPPPSVSITDPSNGATVDGTITVTASASGVNPVTQVEFRVDGSTIGTDTDGSNGWSVSWDTTTVADGGRTLQAIATDSAGKTGSHSINVTVDNVDDPTMHVGDIDGSSANAPQNRWNATATITVHDSAHGTVAGAVVSGTFTPGGSGQCTTNSSGQCGLTLNGIHRNTASVTFTVTNVTHSTYVYESADNHDPDGDSDGTTIVINRP